MEEKIAKSNDSVSIAKHLKSTYIDPAVIAVKKGDNELALEIYTKMMNSYGVYV